MGDLLSILGAKNGHPDGWPEKDKTGRRKEGSNAARRSEDLMGQ